MKAAMNFVMAIAMLPRIATAIALLDSDADWSVIKMSLNHALFDEPDCYYLDVSW